MAKRTPGKANGEDAFAMGRKRGLDIRPRFIQNGTVLFYSADRGQQAMERLTQNERPQTSPFTRIFVDEIAKPNRGIRTVITNTRKRVVELTKGVNHDQRPAYFETLIDRELFLNGEPTNEKKEVNDRLVNLREEIGYKNSNIETMEAEIKRLGTVVAESSSQFIELTDLRRKVSEIAQLKKSRAEIQEFSNYTLDVVRARGFLNCGVSSGKLGFSSPDAIGDWQGLDADTCRAIAASTLGDANAVKFIPLTTRERFTALQAGEIDVLARNSSWTFNRDVALELSFTAPNFWDGQAFMVRKSLGITSAVELSGGSICILAGTIIELNVANYFRANSMEFEPVLVENWLEVAQVYQADRCDVISADRSKLAAMRTQLDNPDAHIILPETITLEGLGPYVRQHDNVWRSVVQWSIYAMLIAEQHGLNSTNIDDMKVESNNPEVERLLGVSGQFHEVLGLRSDWAYQIIRQVGNYSEVFERHIGSETPIGLVRGLNALVLNGGMMTAPRYR